MRVPLYRAVQVTLSHGHLHTPVNPVAAVVIGVTIKGSLLLLSATTTVCGNVSPLDKYLLYKRTLVKVGMCAVLQGMRVCVCVCVWIWGVQDRYRCQCW